MNTENKTVVYALSSDAKTDAPSLFRTLQLAHRQGDTRAVTHMFERWDIPAHVAARLLSGDIPTRVEGRAVVFELPCCDVLPFVPTPTQPTKH